MPNSNLKLILPAVIVLIVGAVLGFVLGSALSSKGGKPIIPSIINNSNNPVFTNQTAFVQGMVTRVNGKVLTIQNSQNKQTGDFEVSDKIFISRVNNGGNPASPSSNLQDISLNQSALINLEYSGGKYKVVSVSYLPNVQVAPPQNASSPATTR